MAFFKRDTAATAEHHEVEKPEEETPAAAGHGHAH